MKAVPAISLKEFFQAHQEFICLMQSAYEPDLFETLQANPQIIVDDLKWSTQLDVIISKSRQSIHASKELSELTRDLINIPYNTSPNFSEKCINPFAQILMIHAHTINGHGSPQATLNEFQTQYWI